MFTRYTENGSPEFLHCIVIYINGVIIFPFEWFRTKWISGARIHEQLSVVRMRHMGLAMWRTQFCPMDDLHTGIAAMCVVAVTSIWRRIVANRIFDVIMFLVSCPKQFWCLSMTGHYTEFVRMRRIGYNVVNFVEFIDIACPNGIFGLTHFATTKNFIYRTHAGTKKNHKRTQQIKYTANRTDSIEHHW